MKKLLSIVSIILLVFALSACNSDNGKKTKIVIYSNHLGSGRDTILAQMWAESEHADKYDLVLVSLGGAQIAERVVAEKHAPIADVAYGGNLVLHATMRDEGALYKYEPSWAENVEEEYKGSEGYSFGTKVEGLYLVYNKNVIAPENAPKDWEDLAENFEGQYQLLNTSGTTASTLYASILYRYRDENGLLGVSDEGWDFMQKLRANSHIESGNWKEDFQEAFPIGMMWGSGIKYVEETYQVDLEVIMPSYGTPVTSSQIAIIDTKDADRIERAKVFVEWVGSVETSVRWAEETSAIPANTEARELVDDVLLENFNLAIPQDLDWIFLSNWTDQWRERIELQYPGGY